MESTWRIPNGKHKSMKINFLNERKEATKHEPLSLSLSGSLAILLSTRIEI